MPRDWVKSEASLLVLQVQRFLLGLADDNKRRDAGISKAQRDALQAGKERLEQRTRAKRQAQAAYRAAVQSEKEELALLQKQLRALGRTAQAAPEMTDPLRSALGLTIRKQTTPGFGEIPVVEDLVCTALARGVHRLDWSGPTGGGITYLIEFRTSPTAPWQILDYTSRTLYLHQTEGTETNVLYRLLPRRGDRKGRYSNAVMAR